jgi:hypothetical protein
MMTNAKQHLFYEVVLHFSDSTREQSGYQNHWHRGTEESIVSALVKIGNYSYLILLTANEHKLEYRIY